MKHLTVSLKTCLLIAIVGAGSIQAAEIYPNTEASANATVQSQGVREGERGQIYFNVQGDSSGNFASFAVADFSIKALGTVQVTKITIHLTQSNTQFSADGELEFWLSSDTMTSITSGSPLGFAFTDPPGGLGTQLGTPLLLGKGAYTKQGTGVPDTFTFTPTDNNKEAFAQLAAVAAKGGTVRLVITAKDTGTVATWAGEKHTEHTGPELSFEYTK